jgi:hypothetical protein
METASTGRLAVARRLAPCLTVVVRTVRTVRTVQTGRMVRTLKMAGSAEAVARARGWARAVRWARARGWARAVRAVGTARRTTRVGGPSRPPRP